MKKCECNCCNHEKIALQGGRDGQDALLSILESYLKKEY